jgi:hypothetical protein
MSQLCYRLNLFLGVIMQAMGVITFKSLTNAMLCNRRNTVALATLILRRAGSSVLYRNIVRREPDASVVNITSILSVEE